MHVRVRVVDVRPFLLFFAFSLDHNKMRHRKKITEVSPSSVIFDVNFLLHKNVH